MNESLEKKTILVVDDTAENIDIVDSILNSTYRVIFALNGESAIKIANSQPQPDLMLLDIMMPGMGGLEVCKLLKENKNTKDIPIVFVTAATDQQTMADGLELGAYYYLTKPVNPVTIKAVVRSAINDSFTYQELKKELDHSGDSLGLLEKGFFKFKDLEDAKQLAIFLAKAYPQPDKIVTGLTELFINAIEHGNLGITYDEKTQLMQDFKWEEEVKLRLTQANYKDKVVSVTFEIKSSEIHIVIQDQGSGFEWERYLQIEASRATHCHGRGIAMANMMSFDAIQYRGIGNEVVAIVKLSC